jgi:hypothetical protein
MSEFFSSLTPESITAFSIAIGAITAAIVKAVGALASLKGTLAEIASALGIGQDETIRQTLDALKLSTEQRLVSLDRRTKTLEVTVARLECAEPAPASGEPALSLEKH